MQHVPCACRSGLQPVGDGVALDLEQVGEVRADLEVERAGDRLPGVIAYRQLLAKTSPDAARTLDDQRRVDSAGRIAPTPARQRRPDRARKSSRRELVTG